MSPSGTFELFEDRAGGWRWRLVTSNGNIIADSGGAYETKQGVKRGVESVKRTAPDAEVAVVEED